MTEKATFKKAAKPPVARKSAVKKIAQKPVAKTAVKKTAAAKPTGTPVPIGDSLKGVSPKIIGGDRIGLTGIVGYVSVYNSLYEHRAGASVHRGALLISPTTVNHEDSLELINDLRHCGTLPESALQNLLTLLKSKTKVVRWATREETDNYVACELNFRKAVLNQFDKRLKSELRGAVDGISVAQHRVRDLEKRRNTAEKSLAKLKEYRTA